MRYIKLTLEDNHPVWVNGAAVCYLHNDDSSDATHSILYFHGSQETLRVKEHAMGLKDLLEKCQP